MKNILDFLSRKVTNHQYDKIEALIKDDKSLTDDEKESFIIYFIQKSGLKTHSLNISDEKCKLKAI